MEAITLAQLLQAVNGTFLAPFDLETTICEVCTDSKEIIADALFAPLIGERFDGHDFISDALEGGGQGCLCAREPDRLLPGKFYVKVENTNRALGDLGRWYKSLFPIPFVCVTGSVGKTTTKDMIAAVLGEKYKVLKTEVNYNNDIGVPKTLLRLDHSIELCVLEMGMNHAGEIDYLTSIANPDTAVITNVGDCHIKYLGSREGIFKAKCEIFSRMERGAAILNGDDVLLTTLRGRLSLDTVFVGAGEGLDYRASELESGMEGIAFTAVTPKSTFRVEVPTPGRHMIYPALTAAAVGERYGLTPEEIARGIANFEPSGMRMNVMKLPDGVTVLNDVYNANPQSMAAGAAVLGDAEGRKVAVVGDMLELGEEAERFHQEVGAAFAAAGADKLIAVGTLARFLAQGANAAGVAETAYYTDIESALEGIRSEKRPGTTILVKASRGMHFERIVAALTQ